MSAQIRPTRLEVSDRFPMLGFSIRADGPSQRAEVALGSEPGLFAADGKARRTPANFYSTRAGGPLQVTRGEAVFVVPPEVLARFIGSEKLYFGLAVSGAENGAMQVVVNPTEASPYVSLKGLTGRSMQRVRILPSRQQRAAGYKGNGQAALEWAGDVATPGMESARRNGGAAAPPPNAAAPTPGGPAAARQAVPYDDTFGPLAPRPAQPAPAAAPPPPPSGTAAPAPSPQAGAGQPPAPAQALDAPSLTTTGQQRPVTPPPVRRLAAWQKALIMGGLGVISGPLAPVVLSLPLAARAAGVSIGIGPAVGAGLLAGGTLGTGVIFGPDGDLGVYGSAEVDAGWIASISATVQITVVRGPIESFNGWSVATAISGGEGLVAGAAALFDANANFQGISVSAGVGAGFSPVDYYVAVQRGVARQLGLAAALGQLPRPQPAAAVAGAKGRPARTLDADPLALDVKYRMFIPSPLIDSPTAVFGGDGRGFSYDGGTSRGEIHATVRLTPGGGIAGIDLIDRHWGESTQYATADSHHVAGRPDWWLDRNEGAQPTDRATLAVSDDNLRIYVGAPGTTRPVQAIAEQASLVTIEAAGSLPLSMVAPAIDSDISLFIRIANGGVEVKVQGEHDGFPCHELYVNGRRLYSFDPVASSSSPEALLPPMDITANTGWINVASLAAGQSAALSSDSFTINWDEVEAIAQPTDLSCWATAAAMVIGWRDRLSLTPEAVAAIARRSIRNDLDPAAVQAFAGEMGLVFESPQSYTVDGFRRLLATNGPLFVVSAVPTQHAIVVSGLYGDGTDTYVRITDPWDRAVGSPGSPGGYLDTHATGSRYIMKWQDFVAEYERAATDYSRVNLQILHSGPQPGRTANTGRSTPPGYAQGLSARSLGGDPIVLPGLQFATTAWTVAPPVNLNGEGTGGATPPTPDEFIRIWRTELGRVAGGAAARLQGLADLAQSRSWAIAVGAGAMPGIAIGSAIGPGLLITAEGQPFTYGPGRLDGGPTVDPVGPAVMPRVTDDAPQITIVEGSGVLSFLSWGLAVPFRTSDRRVSQGAVLLKPDRGFLGVTFKLNPFDGLAPDAVFDAVKAGFAAAPATMIAQGQARALADPEPAIRSMPLQRHVTGAMNNVTYDLVQYDGLKEPARRPAGTGGVADGQRVDLGDWPFLPAANPNAIMDERSRAPVTIDWHYQNGAVGDVRITPGPVQAFDGWSITLTATVADGPDTPNIAALRVTVRTTFSKPGEADHVAVTNVTLYGDGRPPVREDAWELPGVRIAA